MNPNHKNIKRGTWLVIHLARCVSTSTLTSPTSRLITCIDKRNYKLYSNNWPTTRINDTTRQLRTLRNQVNAKISSSDDLHCTVNFFFRFDDRLRPNLALHSWFFIYTENKSWVPNMSHFMTGFLVSFLRCCYLSLFRCFRYCLFTIDPVIWFVDSPVWNYYRSMTLSRDRVIVS